MAARLEWDDDHLMLGGAAGWALAYLDDGNTHEREPGMWRYVLSAAMGRGAYGTWRRSRGEATQDCETEVRRLLKEAGVDVE